MRETPMNISFDSTGQKRISFILTTKNHADYLERALPQIEKLITPTDEFIVVDGGSTDRTGEILKKWNHIVSTVISEPDDSISHGFNKGVLIAKGKYVKQVYDDDVIHPEAMEETIQVFEKNPDIDVLVCGGTKAEEGEENTIVYVPPGVGYGARAEDPFRYRACGTGFVMRRRVFAKVGLFPTGWAGDKGFIAQAIARGAVVKFLRVNLFSHPVYPHSIVNKRRKEHEADSERMIRQFCSRQFYIRYRIFRALKRVGLAGAVEKILISLRSGGTKKERPLTAAGERERYKWDGGFS